MQKEIKVVMLSSDNKSDIVTWGKNLRNSSMKIKDDYDVAFALCAKYQHLYFLSDEEIKDGDWFIYDNTLYNRVKKSLTPSVTVFIELYPHLDLLERFREVYISDCKKIIATTDTSLLKDFNKEGDDGFDLFPQPSKKWLEHFITEYNKGNKLEKVMVEYDVTHISGAFDIDDMFEFGGYDIERLKINSDNTINI